MSLHLVVVGFNEASRYLASMLEWNGEMADTVFYYDDQSTDGSVAIAESRGATTVSRPDSVPSFIDNEAIFRQAAWWAFETAMKPQPGDWVLSLDTDEFLAGDPRVAVARSQELNYSAFQCHVAEVFDWQPPDSNPDDNLLVRLDGYWGQISAVRLVAYQPLGTFARDGIFQPMGGGSVPTYVNARNTLVPDSFTSYITILHMGYALEADRKAKYERYRGRAGHNPRHIETIITAPTLTRWGGDVPRIWVGK